MLATTIFLAVLAGFVSLSTAGYVLEDDYSPDKFFSMFDFFTAPDPTNGYVTYVGQSAAQAAGLVNTNNNAVYMGVDFQNQATGSGRQSVRITSKKSYTRGLIILDLSHMPGGICGTWPAFWTVGPNWPQGGEIDIIEGVNSYTSNSMALHTNQGCSITNTGLFSGSVATSNCDVQAAGQPYNAGCQIKTSNTASYGDGFNQGQGGVYATEWTSSHISIWFFARGAIPADVSSGTPDPSNWGQPAARFAGGCEIDNFFSSNQIVFDTTFCGDWAGNVWSTDPVCSSKAPTCQAFVQNNPAAFKNAYWTVNSLKVYQSTDGGSSPPPANPSPNPQASSVGVSVTANPPPTPWNSFPAQSQTLGPASFDGEPPSTGFSRGGNGRHSRTWGDSWGGNAKFFAVETQAPTAVDASPSADTTPAPEVGAGSGDGEAPDGDNVQYITVTAMTYDDFDGIEGDAINDKRDVVKQELPRSPIELGDLAEAETSRRDILPHEMEKRSVEKARHLQTHRHVRRHLFHWGTEEK